MDENKTLSPPVDPWAGHPLFPTWGRGADLLYEIYGRTRRPLVVPVIAGRDGAQRPSWKDLL